MSLKFLLEDGKILERRCDVFEGHQDLEKRQVPYHYLMLQRSLFRELKMKVAVEIGSARMPLVHFLHNHGNAKTCCNDGHSTYHFYECCEILHTVDIGNFSANFPQREGFFVHQTDGIEFLKNFNGKIDFLFLDSWDVVDGDPYAEKHLEAYEAAKDKFSHTHMIGIDDTDVFSGGKGRLLIPRLIEEGYEKITSGRQTIFLRGV